MFTILKMRPTIFVNNLYISLFFCTFAVPILKRGLTGTTRLSFGSNILFLAFRCEGRSEVESLPGLLRLKTGL